MTVEFLLQTNGCQHLGLEEDIYACAVGKRCSSESTTLVPGCAVGEERGEHYANVGRCEFFGEQEGFSTANDDKTDLLESAKLRLQLEQGGDNVGAMHRDRQRPGAGNNLLQEGRLGERILAGSSAAAASRSLRRRAPTAEDIDGGVAVLGGISQACNARRCHLRTPHHLPANAQRQ